MGNERYKKENKGNKEIRNKRMLKHIRKEKEQTYKS